MENPQQTIRLLQEELAETNREVVALTLELEKRVEARTLELQAAQAELQRTNSELRQLTVDLEGRVAVRAAELAASNEALRQSESRFRHVVEQSIVGIYIIQNQRFTYVNPKMAEIFGCSPEDMTSTSLYDFIAEDSRALARENIRRRVAGEIQSAHYTLQMIRHGGAIIDAEVHGSRVDFDDGPGILGCLIDVTERKENERKTKAHLNWLDLLSRTTRAIGERQDLRSIFQVVIRSLEDSLPVDFACICLHNSASQSLTVACVGAKSEALALELALTEQARVEVDGNGLSRCVRGQLVYEPDIVPVSFPFPQRLARSGLRSLVVAPLLVEAKIFGVLVVARRVPASFSSDDCEFLRQLSEHVALAANQAHLHQALQQAYDDLRQTQQAVMQQERLRALGQMASGIAHDINNAISPAALYVESLLEREPNLSPRAREYLETIQRAVEDVASTVARMREFYRPREPQLALVPVDANQLIRQVVDLTRARWHDMPQQQGAVIGMNVEVAPDLPSIMAIESEIREALVNLVFNAVDAMPRGGTIALRTGLHPAGETGSKAVRIEVADTGQGMDEETLRRCLEPFYTTKGERGTGLGLAMVYGIAQRHSADLEIESTVGQGTTVRLSFTVPEIATASADAPVPSPEIKPRLRILIVDDDPLLLKSLRDILEGEGHFISTANGGQAGIDTFTAVAGTPEAFQTLITDLGMPYVDGRQVAAAAKNASPETQVILLTGWGRRLIDEGEIPAHVDCVLSKPPKLRELREVLARGGRPALP